MEELTHEDRENWVKYHLPRERSGSASPTTCCARKRRS
jgi:hypothetical protein